MTISLPTILEDFVRRKVANGDFKSAEDVVCEGLRLLQRQEEWKADAHRKIDAGWQQARNGELRTAEELRESLTSRKQDWKREHNVE